MTLRGLKVTRVEGYNAFMEAVNMIKRGQILLLHRKSKMLVTHTAERAFYYFRLNLMRG